MGTFIEAFKAKYVNLDWQSPTVLLETEVFENIRLSPGQSIDDYYCQLVEKSSILHKPDHEVLTKFIKGLPDRLAFFVRAGNHKDSTSALSAARMGEAYGYRNDEPVVAAARKSESSENAQYVKLQEQITNLTEVVKDLKLQQSADVQNKPRNYTKPKRQPAAQEVDKNTCFSCKSKGHYRRQCNWNGKGNINPDTRCQLCEQYGHIASQYSKGNNPDTRCQLCEQFGHIASQCSKLKQPENYRFSVDTRHGPPGRRF